MSVKRIHSHFYLCCHDCISVICILPLTASQVAWLTMLQIAFSIQLFILKAAAFAWISVLLFIFIAGAFAWFDRGKEHYQGGPSDSSQLAGLDLPSAPAFIFHGRSYDTHCLHDFK